MAKIEITIKDNDGNITGKKEYDLELAGEKLDDIEDAVEKLKNEFLPDLEKDLLTNAQKKATKSIKKKNIKS